MTFFMDAFLFIDTIRTIEERYIVPDYLLGAALLPVFKLSNESVTDSLVEVKGNWE